MMHDAIEQLRVDLGHRKLNKLWAKIEIMLGLLASGAGLLLGVWSVTQNPTESLMACSGLLLFTLGSYLAMAGHRSHLYQSNNQLAAYLAALIRNSK